MAKRIFSLTAVCLLGFMLLPAGNKSTQTLSAPDAPAREATSGEVPDERLLFPELTDSDISEIHIRAGDDCAFDFSLRGELSVNGAEGRRRGFFHAARPADGGLLRPLRGF